MATTYTLRFTRFKLIDVDGMTDVIRQMDYGLTATTNDPEPIEVYVDGRVTLDYPGVGSFIQRANVTPSNTQNWFATLVDDEGNNLLTVLKAKLDAKIAAKQAAAVRDDKPGTEFRTGVSV